ncbi:MAG: nucleoside-diphosphate kinase [Phycisphaeraceae bacterium]
MAIQTTLIILKPDAVQRGLMGRIISRFEEKGLTVVGAKMMLITKELAGRHYAVHAGRPFYDGLVKFMTSAPVLVLAVRGHEAISVCRTLMGETNAVKTLPGSIRGDFSCSRSFNLVHGSDGEETAASEVALFFKKEELLDYTRVTDAWAWDTSSGKPE